jgi:deoxyribodipyrimidine photo-lyase
MYKKATEKLHNFITSDLRHYAAERNYDIEGHANVSQLSPYISYRALREDEVIRAALNKYSYNTIQKFIDEVFWRTYWKGWLEHRPQIWHNYWQDVQTLHEDLPKDYHKAIEGQTGIDCFDYWVRELTETGYLHNHARMWFASIWIFTLELPWQLGADFFMQNLLDGDAASNTLSWRWVAGLQTKGKTYLARASNIKKYTHDRFDPQGLADEAQALKEPYDKPEALAPTYNFDMPKDGRIGLLITESDVRAHEWIEGDFTATAAINLSQNRAVEGVATNVNNHVNKFMQGIDMIEDIAQWKNDNNLDHIVTARMPVGHVRHTLQNHDIIEIDCAYDAACWPYATKGFFGFKKYIPDLIEELNLTFKR